MEVLETIQKRRTIRIPFNERKVLKRDLDVLLEISRLSPNGDPVSWELVSVEDYATKSRLAQIVEDDFGDVFQKDSQKFRRVFSQYPRWMHFSEAKAKDGVVLDKPKFAKYFYNFALGKTFGPLFGKLGIMNSEFKAYCKNIINNPLLFGVFRNRHFNAGSAGIASLVNTGSMLQNLRLTATSLGLCYQDIGWITATKESSEKARQLLKMPEDYVAINFFRIGYIDDLDRRSQNPNFRSAFRRDLKDIVNFGKFGNKNFEVAQMRRTDLEVLDAIRGRKAERVSKPVSKDELGYILEAARWAPSGFNVQPFEFVVIEQEDGASIAVLENMERRDPDPGPCEALAKGGVLQNIRLAARALGLNTEIKKPALSEEESLRQTLYIPKNYSLLSLIEL
ncbi:MAG: nitroreductase family protein [Elusimicrobia bacterium]|nr:nitroreductase family protein [Elusimicrobiota bacterium]